MVKGLLQLENEIAELERASILIEKELMKMPVGRLKINKSLSGASRMYWLGKEETTGKYIEKYLSKKKDTQLITDLAQKQYLERLLKAINNEKEFLKKAIAQYRPNDKYDCYNNLDSVRKLYVRPVYEPIDIFVDNWINEDYIADTRYPEKLIYETDRGEYVRSKSEVIIANYLNSRSDIFYYKYECPLYLKKSGITVHPDFTIINKISGNIYYYEHLGMLDDASYSNSFVKKLNLYIKEDIIPGKNLILTYETSEKMLEINNIKKILEETAI